MTDCFRHGCKAVATAALESTNPAKDGVWSLKGCFTHVSEALVNSTNHQGALVSTPLDVHAKRRALSLITPASQVGRPR